jgi:hypothetical protein
MALITSKQDLCPIGAVYFGQMLLKISVPTDKPVVSKIEFVSLYNCKCEESNIILKRLRVTI